MRYFIYDLETFYEQFLFSGKFYGEDTMFTFEISKRVNQRNELLQFLSWLQNSGAVMVGFNNLGFDYPIVHELLNNPYTFTELTAYAKCQEIIKSQNYGLTHIPMRERIIPQLDLVKINHFDNHARRTSLKSLQFAMRSESVEDLPFDPSASLTNEQMDLMVKYNHHDILETEKFFTKCMHVVQIRKEILEQGVLQGDVLNYSDVKLGTEYLVKKIGRAKCFIGSQPKQTFRESIEFKNIILNKISFRTERFQGVLDWFKAQTIWIKKEDERPRLELELAGLPFNFGVGGVHASVEDKYYASNDTHVIRDIDVSGMYVAVAIANGFYPEHLGQEYVTAYRQLQQDRKAYPKGSSMNLILKLAGNGAFGNSNNSYSCMYDPKYTFSVTVNGQLQLLQLVEVLSLIPDLEIIQTNTDGVTVYLPRKIAHLFDLWKADWESQTNLKLEDVEYSKMWIRDVNNYLAITTKGEVKRKGCFWYPVQESDYWGGSGSNWNKDFSNMSAQKGIEQVLTTGCTPEQIVKLISDPFDLMLRYKTTAGAKVYIGNKEMLKTVRYYVSTKGEKMQKIAKPRGEIGTWKRKNGLTDSEFERISKTVPAGQWDERIHNKKKSKYTEVVTSIENGRLVKCCNHVKDFDWSDVDYDYYAKEIAKLMIGGQSVQPLGN
jgi:hypothetical protein